MEDSDIELIDSIISIDSDMQDNNAHSESSKSYLTEVVLSYESKEGSDKDEEVKLAPSSHSQLSKENIDIPITSSVLGSDIQEAPQAQLPTVEELKPRLHYTNHKAGMDKVDHAEIERKIYEISK